MSKRKYSIHKAPGNRQTDRERETLAIAWNGYIYRCRRISLRHFARIHGVAYETWRREYNRGAPLPARLRLRALRRQVRREPAGPTAAASNAYAICINNVGTDAHHVIRITLAGDVKRQYSIHHRNGTIEHFLILKGGKDTPKPNGSSDIIPFDHTIGEIAVNFLSAD